MKTRDDYLLGVHRLAYRKGEEGKKVNAGEGSIKKRVVYLHHGLLMNSEVWVCLTDEARCLPFRLVEAGYDVWLGNNRGNKYSKKSTRLSPSSHQFWDFSIDDFAFYDIPDSIDYILDTTGQKTLSYIGFSQGTAQAFATLSIHPALNEKVNVFIALAPAMSPAGLSSGVVDALMKTSPSVVFLAFGRRSILSSTTMWQSILYPPIYLQVIDAALRFLFNWQGKNITLEQKLAAYPHLYSFTSTKSVVHWFQIIRNKSFQMYDDEVQAPLPLMSTSSSRYYRPARFPTRNIRTPIVLLYGGSDSLVDINIMLRELPSHTVAKGVPHYEHLDFLWGNAIDELVFPHVFEALHKHEPGRAKAIPGQKSIAAGSLDGSIDSSKTGTSYNEYGWTGVLPACEIAGPAASDTDHDLESSTLISTSQSPEINVETGHYAAKIPANISNKLTSHTPSPPPQRHHDTVSEVPVSASEDDSSSPVSSRKRGGGGRKRHSGASTLDSELRASGSLEKIIGSGGISVGKAGASIGRLG